MVENIQSTPYIIEEYIKKEIQAGNLTPGDKLPSERDLVKKLNVSRSSVREAIKSLTIMGYLEPVERKGTFISDKYKNNKYAYSEFNNVHSRAPIFDLMEVRLMLEERFIPIVIERATKKDIETLKKALLRIKNSNDDVNEFFQGDLDFHFALADATHNVIIIEIMKIIKNRIYDDKSQFVAAGIKTRKTTIDSFSQIIIHITNKDTENASLIYHIHLHEVEEFLKNH
jgi:GntR family transcriptional repressor for pyruvate dehydrogenase complex